MKKKIFISLASLFTICIIIFSVIIKNADTVYSDYFPDRNITVRIKDSDGFGFVPVRNHKYRLIVKQKGLVPKTLRDTEFMLYYDGSADNISSGVDVEFVDDVMVISIEGESAKKTFRVYL